MVSISLGAKVALIVIGAVIIGAGAIVFIITFTWFGRWFDSILFFFLFIPMGLLLMLSAVIFGTKPSAPKYPGYPPYSQQYQTQGQYPPQYQTQGQYPPQPQDFAGQQKAYGQMYDQTYQYGYQEGYWLGLQKAYEQMYKSNRQPYQQPYQYYQQQYY